MVAGVVLFCLSLCPIAFHAGWKPAVLVAVSPVEELRRPSLTQLDMRNQQQESGYSDRPMDYAAPFTECVVDQVAEHPTGQRQDSVDRDHREAR